MVLNSHPVEITVVEPLVDLQKLAKKTFLFNTFRFASSHHLKSTDVRRRPWIFYFLLYFQYLSLRLSKTNPPMYLHQRIYYRS